MFRTLVLLLLISSADAFSLTMKTNVVAGATGYIGKSVVRESVRQGYKTVALVRNLDKVRSEQGQALYGEYFEGAQVVECDVSDPKALAKVSGKESCSVLHTSYLPFPSSIGKRSVFLPSFI